MSQVDAQPWLRDLDEQPWLRDVAAPAPVVPPEVAVAATPQPKGFDMEAWYREHPIEKRKNEILEARRQAEMAASAEQIKNLPPVEPRYWEEAGAPAPVSRPNPDRTMLGDFAAAAGSVVPKVGQALALTKRQVGKGVGMIPGLEEVGKNIKDEATQAGAQLNEATQNLRPSEMPEDAGTLRRFGHKAATIAGGVVPFIAAPAAAVPLAAASGTGEMQGHLVEELTNRGMSPEEAAQTAEKIAPVAGSIEGALQAIPIHKAMSGVAGGSLKKVAARIAIDTAFGAASGAAGETTRQLGEKVAGVREDMDLGAIGQAALESGGTAGVIRGGREAVEGVRTGVRKGVERVAETNDKVAAAAYPEVVQGDEGPARGTPEANKKIKEADDAIKAEADAAEYVVKNEKPETAIVKKGDVIDSIPANQEDKFALQNVIERQEGDFVRVKLKASDFTEFPTENLDPEKVGRFASMDTEAPPVIAVPGENGLRLLEGRHRVLAEGLRLREAGGNPNDAEVTALVPQSWAAKQGIPPAGSGGGMGGAGKPPPPGAVPPAGGPPPSPGRKPANVTGIGYPQARYPANLPAKVAMQSTATPPVRQRTGLQALARAFENSAANRPEQYVRQRERLTGMKSLARMDVVEGGIKDLDQITKKHNLDLDDRTTQYQITEVLRGHKSAQTLPDDLKNWVHEQRKGIDALESEIVTEARNLGMDDFADSVEKRMGTYLAVAPIKRAGQTVPGGSSRERLNPEVGHFRRDRYVVTDGNGKVVGDAADEAGAQALMQRAAATRTGKAAAMTMHEPIPEEWRMANEIHDPRFLLGRTMVEGTHLREMMKLLQVAKPHATAPAQGLNSSQEAAWAKQNGLGKVVDDARLGPISGKYLPIRMAEDFNQAIRMPGEVERLWLTFNSAWKLSKTAFNLPTSGHNVASNALTFAYLDGISPMNPANWKFYKEAATASKNNPVWRKMVEANFAGTGGRYAGEIRGLMEDAANFDTYLRNSLLRGAKKGVQGVQEFYGAQDDIFKMAAVLKRVKAGMSVEDAIADARKWWPDNARASKIARWLSNAPLGSSFIRFTDQAMRIAGRAAVEHPVRLGMIASMPLMLNALSRSWLGLSKDNKEEKMMEEGRSYAEPLVPWRDNKGRLQTFDMRYIIPLANDVLPEQRYGMLKLPIVGNTPVATAMLEQFSGRDRFTGREFVNDEMSTGQNLKARTGQLAKTLAPVPSMLTYGVKDIKNAATGQSERVLSHAILNQLTGVNIQTPYIAERNVRKIARNMLGEHDVRQARDFVETWNDTYKPGNLTDITMKDVAQGLRQSVSSDRSKVIKQATDLIFQGDEAGAQKLIEDYNKDRKIGRVSFGAAKAEARKQSVQNRSR